jgi:hypothetical protein
MSLRGLLNPIWLILLSMLLTAVGAVAEPANTDRRAYVTEAFEGFHGMLYFLSGNERFLGQLTPEEKAQFMLLGNQIIQHRFILGPAAVPGQDRTSTQVDFKLRFSDRREDFILNPGEPERTAKMDGDIWFNLHAINNPTSKFGLLDAFQIMFHEFGHKLGAAKDQEAIDRVAAKIRTQLTGFYKETIVNAGLKAVSLIFPYISVPHGPVDYQFEPIVILDRGGQALSAKLDMRGMNISGQMYLPNEARAQSFLRTTVVPTFSEYQGQLLIKWQVSNQQFFIPLHKFNYLDLYASLDKVKGVDPLPLTIAENLIYQMVSKEELNSIPRKTAQPVTLPLKNFSQDNQSYRQSADVNFLEPIRLVEEKNNRLTFATEIKSATPITEAVLIGTLSDSGLYMAGKVESLGADRYRLVFNVPASSSRSQFLYLKAIGLNGDKRWDFAEILKHPVRNVGVPKRLAPLDISFWNGKQFEPFNKIGSESMNTDEVRLRMVFPEPTADIERVDFSWTMDQKIKKDAISMGLRLYNVREIIGRDQIKQTRQNGTLIVEFTSKKASQAVPVIQAQQGFTLEDGGNRFLMLTQVMDAEYNIFAVGSRVPGATFKSVFTVDPKKPPQVITCEGLF